MEEGETVSLLSRKELRKQKLMEYLTAKGKQKDPNSKPHLSDDRLVKKPLPSEAKVVSGKENKTLADKFGYEQKKVSSPSSVKPPRKVFGVSNKVNVNGIQTGRQITDSKRATNDLAQAKLKPTLTKSYTGAFSKPNLGGNLKNHVNAETQSSARSSSKSVFTALSKSTSRFSSCSNAAWSCPMKVVSSRISLGPLVRTRTGLVPAVTQSKQAQSQNLRCTSTLPNNATATGTIANRSRSIASTSVTASKRPAVAQKMLPSTALNKLVRDKSVSLTAACNIKPKVQNKSGSKCSLLSSKSQISCGQEPAFNVPKQTVALDKLEGTVRATKLDKSAGQPSDRSIKQMFGREVKKNIQQCKVPSRPSQVPASRCSSRGISAVVPAAAPEHGVKTKTFALTDTKKMHSSVTTKLPQTGLKKTVSSVVSRTVPRPVRTSSHTGQVPVTKATKAPAKAVPQTEGRKQTAAQEERMRKLKEWREAKGISYKRPPMPVKPQVKRTEAVVQPFWITMKEEDEAHSLICAVDRSLADCIKLLEEGCHPDQVRAILSRLPVVSQKFAKYWICRARLMEQEGNLDVLPMFEEAVSVVLEPVDELRTVVFEILKRKDELQASNDKGKEEEQIPAGETSPEIVNNLLMTPKPVRARICGEKGNSSVVKYKITTTPGGPPNQQREPRRVNGQEIRFFTPVRRSVRIERASLRYPESLQDHDLCVASYDDLIKDEEDAPAEDTPMYVYRQNEALHDKVSVQLVCEDGGYSVSGSSPAV